ncbi:hypothetical protein OEZ85_010091 [Tetradesmus obliquus]|uniref:Uncharacterized protein n=1 Tax=Tetradesmus obliquus TaxID=3088 RepID=A0ABY8TL94_TETOB|nr:hypothetical protein OEZ85_010091 [Tetradesmus obliquus]
MNSSSRGKLAGVSLPVPNETRLHELYALAQRKQAVLPGPGAYEVARVRASAGSHRRPHQAQLDGPFPLAPGQTSLRCQQISSLLLLGDSGQAPGAYDGPSCKDATSCLARAPTPKVSRPQQMGVAPYAQCLGSSQTSLAVVVLQHLSASQSIW